MRSVTTIVAAGVLVGAVAAAFAAPPSTPPGHSDGHPGQGNAGPNMPQNYIAAPLSGLNEVPEVESDGGGVCLIRMRGDVLTYKLIVEDLSDVTQAHLHLGKPGENGPIVAFLFGLVEEGVASDGILAEGVLDDDAVIERPALDFDGTREALIREMRAGNVYVNVHTVAHPAGEIRGQVRSLGPQGKGGDDEEDAPGSASSLLGDLNGDGVVDTLDLQILMDNFTPTQPTVEEDDEQPSQPTPRRGRRPMR